MILLLAGLALAPLQNPVTDLLLEVRKHYGTLERFEARIVHHDSSGLFPGDYEQHLVWTGKHTFELKVTKKSGYKPIPGHGGTNAPDYIAKGGTVTSRPSDRPEHTEDIVPRPNTMPGWEVSGGVALSFLENTHNVDLYFGKERPDYEVAMSMGTTKLWKKHAVREIVIEWKGPNHTAKGSLFIDAKRPLFVGDAYNGGWMLYEDVRTVPPNAQSQ